MGDPPTRTDIWTLPVTEAKAKGHAARWRWEAERLRVELRFAEARIAYWTERAAALGVADDE